MNPTRTELLNKMRFKRAEGFSRYRLYEDGSIYSEITNKFLKPTVSKRGYMRAGVFNDNKKLTQIFLSKLMALAFFGKPKDPKMQCAHLDGNKLNNHISNLKWVTQNENERHKIIHGTCLIGERHPRSKVSDLQREEIKKRYVFNKKKRISNSDVLGREFGITPTQILYIAKHFNKDKT